MNSPIQNSARLATLDKILETTAKAFFDPPPKKDTLRNWFDDANVPRFKANPTAKRGGGTTWYSVPAVEKLFRSRLLPGTASMIRSRGRVMGG
jgi:hypothetical protein